MLSGAVLVAVALTSCTAPGAAGVLGTEAPQASGDPPAAAANQDADDDHQRVAEVGKGQDPGVGGEPMHEMDRHNLGVGEHPAWGEADQAAALQRGRKAMQTFARPDLAQVVWLEGVLALADPQAGENFAYIDPATITATEVHDAALAPTSTASMAQVIATTDGGEYVVTMTRLTAGGPWLVQRINQAQDQDESGAG